MPEDNQACWPSAVIERFWSKVDISGGPDACWPWLGYITEHGYGRFSASRLRRHSSHRFAYELLVGSIPEGLSCDHECHNRDAACPGGSTCPHRRCTNVLHLRLVTPTENRRNGRNGDTRSSNGQQAGDDNARKTHCIYGHPFTPENTRVTPDGWRVCRECRRVWNRERQARLKDAQRKRNGSTLPTP